MMDADVDGHRYLLIRMPEAERKCAPLSPREIEIVRLVAAGHPNKVIAAVLEISSWTVCTHVRRVFAKLGVNWRAAMVARSVEIGGTMDMTRPAPSPRPTKAYERAGIGMDRPVHRYKMAAEFSPRSLDQRTKTLDRIRPVPRSRVSER